MKKQIKNNKKVNQKGITLIALVITIIVLLILAGVTINMVLGDDGIIERAQQAGEKYNEKEDEEVIRLVYLAERADKLGNGKEMAPSDIQSELEKTYEAGNVKVKELDGVEDGFKVIITKEGEDKIYTIAKNAEVAKVETFEFTIGENENAVICKAEEGMTWRDWLASDYNTVYDDYFLSVGNNTIVFVGDTNQEGKYYELW